MHWYTIVRERQFAVGAVRKRFKFAFMPTAVSDETVWLEKYLVEEEFEFVAHVTNPKWVVINKYSKETTTYMDFVLKNNPSTKSKPKRKIRKKIKSLRVASMTQMGYGIFHHLDYSFAWLPVKVRTKSNWEPGNFGNTKRVWLKTYIKKIATVNSIRSDVGDNWSVESDFICRFIYRAHALRTQYQTWKYE